MVAIYGCILVLMVDHSAYQSFNSRYLAPGFCWSNQWCRSQSISSISAVFSRKISCCVRLMGLELPTSLTQLLTWLTFRDRSISTKDCVRISRIQILIKHHETSWNHWILVHQLDHQHVSSMSVHTHWGDGIHQMGSPAMAGPEWNWCFLKDKALDGTEAAEPKSDCHPAAARGAAWWPRDRQNGNANETTRCLFLVEIHLISWDFLDPLC